MKLALSLSLMFGLCACATAPEPPLDASRFSHAEISAIVSSHFDTPAAAASKALRPSFDKFGAPKRYVSGNMSSVDEAQFERLYGFGDIYARPALGAPVFWQIDGEGLTGDVAPIATVHLIYEPDPFEKVSFTAAEMQTRRGHSFTVFERRFGAQIIVSIYPTARLSKQAEFKTLIFESH